MATRGDCACEHEFVLVLSGVSDLSPAVADALFEAGCDDATASLRFGRVYLTFSREAQSIKDAIFSAIRDVRRAGIGADVVSVDDCNLVTQSEIARRIGRPRQVVGQYVTGSRGPGNFPPPACDIAAGHPLWYWCEVSYWLWQNGIVGDDVLDRSRIISAINSVLAMRHQTDHDPSLVEEVSRFFNESIDGSVACEPSITASTNDDGSLSFVSGAGHADHAEGLPGGAARRRAKRRRGPR